jgi:FixJ family two-component response regulator
MENRTIIAVVDDDKAVRDALRELLRSMGFDVVVFASAEAFLASRHREQVDCLITDVHLPGMNGAALVQSLARAGIGPPALLITAHDDRSTLELIRQTAPVAHLRKPFSDDELAAAIARALAA